MAKSNTSKFSAPVDQDSVLAAISTVKSNEPSLLPAEAIDGIAVWKNNTKIVSTWGKAQDKNAWLNVSGLGFRKIKNSNAQSLLAMLMIGAHARDKGSVVNVRTESDNMIYEIYAW
ncbi:hypothetical protein GCM10027051_19140 [Niabella terrae]